MAVAGADGERRRRVGADRRRAASARLVAAGRAATGPWPTQGRAGALVRGARRGAMRRVAALLAAALLLGGCGIGPGEEQRGRRRHPRHARLRPRASSARPPPKTLREDQTVMRLTAVEVRRRRRASAAASCSRSTGSRAPGAGGRRDWFFFVNGVEAEVGAAEYELSPGRPRPVGLPRLGRRRCACRRSSARSPSRSCNGIEGKRRPGAGRVRRRRVASPAATPRTRSSAWTCRCPGRRSARPAPST